MVRVSTFVCLAVLIAMPLWAQTSANGSIQGIVVDENGGRLPGVTVTAKSPTAPFTYSATTDASGEYRLIDVAPGDYAVVAELTGFSRTLQSGVAVRAGVNLKVDLTMAVGAVTETVDVRAEAPLLESLNAVQSVNVSGELLRAMPLSERREWFGALYLAPGVTTAQWVNNETLVYVHGAGSSSNIIQIDGADMSAALTSGVRYVSLNTDGIDDIQVKTAGVDASAPLGLGGIINIASSSGTNRVKGAVTTFFQPRSWNASNVPGGTSSDVSQKQADVSLGGPLVKDRLWAFGSYRRVDTTSGISRTANQIAVLTALAPNFTSLDNTNLANFLFLKGTSELFPAHRVEGFYQRDYSPATFVDAIALYGRTEATGGSGASLRMSSIWSNHITSRLGISFNNKRRDGQDLGIPGPERVVYSSTISSGGLLFGNGLLAAIGSPITAWGGQPNSKVTLSIDSTIVVDSRWGSHELQVGVYAQPRTRNAVTTSWVNNGYVLEEAVLRVPGVPTSGIVPFHRLTFDGDRQTDVDRIGQDYAVYIQDAWRPANRLTINAGVRVDRITWNDQIFNVTTERATAVGPRVGLNYAITADTKNILRAHWVRVHDQPSQTAVSAGSTSLGQRDSYDLNLDGIFETSFFTPGTTTLTPGRTFDPNFHQPFAQEWGAGYDHQFDGRLTAAIDVVHRAYRDRPTLVETNGKYVGNVFTGYIDENYNQLYRVTNNIWNTPIYNSVELSATKRTDRIQAIASYVRQWRHMDGTWQPNDPAWFIQPSAFANNNGIGSPLGTLSSTGDGNSLSGTNMAQATTASAQWQDHTVRVGLTYQAPWRMLLATNYTFQSGGWSGPIVTRIAAPDPAFGPSQVTLSNGRRVTNPLATTIRFAYPTRGDGQTTTPTLHIWNVRAGRAFAFGDVKLEAAIDVFNVTNNGADQSFQASANQLFNPLYGSTQYRQLPRSAQLMIRASF